MQINADVYTPVDWEVLPVGHAQPVGGSAFDLRVARPLADVLPKVAVPDSKHKGFDHNFVVANWKPGKMGFVARLWHPDTKRYFVMPIVLFSSCSRERNFTEVGMVEIYSASSCYICNYIVI